jgi:hypothetical protein
LTKRRLKKTFEEFGKIEGIHVRFSKKEKIQRCICLQMLKFVSSRKARCKYSLVKSKFQQQECSNKAFFASSSLSMS